MSHGMRVIASRNGFRIDTTRPGPNVPLQVEIYRAGVLLKKDYFQSVNGWCDDCRGQYPGCGIDPTECGVRVLDTQDNVIAIMDVEVDPFPFMKPRKEQVHVTENYVAVPPALTITDTVGDVWTLGFSLAPKHQSPDGEFAFNVLRNGVDTHEIASRIERRSGKIKIFTCHGWKVWTGVSFF